MNPDDYTDFDHNMLAELLKSKWNDIEYSSKYTYDGHQMWYTRVQTTEDPTEHFDEGLFEL